jgi:hypothetical protein
MHVSLGFDVIKKKGTLKAYREAHEAYVEQRKVGQSKQRALWSF